ncbi:serine hydrolase [Hymenobacter sp. HMF4947]|uniref:Serine hydrolase n=1 Tax=Hymenobacter ginkgonis TaxID=2682976 RepID=A0A7K1THC8_9BACT|nr:serine hydrolase domain-containing protein [Hymenobacter ginkgonis]MVN77808.1 serine hydrolase [Hymenobacter ginkgonis]
MLKTMLHLLLGCLACATALAQPATVRHLKGRSISADQLTAGLARVVDSARVTGLSVLVLQGRRVAYEHYFGTKDSRTRAPFDAETISYAASLTKPVTAYVFLRLVDQGVFALDTPVYRYLPRPIAAYEKWHDLALDPSFRRITARMLLSHSAGLPVLRDIYGPQLATIAPPGTRFFYSNEGFNLLGTVMEEHTGLPLQTLAERELFGPLHMTHTAFVWQERFAGNHAVGHDPAGKALGYQLRTSARGAGSMVTTPRDYAAFVRHVLARKSLSRQLYRQYFGAQIAVTSQRGWGPRRDSLLRQSDPARKAWGLGWGLFASPYGPAFWHGGHYPGWQNLCVCYPQRGLAVILLSNSDNFEPVADRVLRLCSGDAAAPLEWSGFFDAAPAASAVGSSK